MPDHEINKSDRECTEMLSYLFGDARQLYSQLAPDGLKNSELVLFFHPTPEQRYKEATRMRDNINRLFRKSKDDEEGVEEIKLSDFEPDDLRDIEEYD